MSNTLVMLQTNSNQPFIFSSPRLREQIGASFEITLLSRWVEEEAKCLLRAEDLPNTFWVSDSSGKVIVRFAGHDDAPESLARQLIRRVTLRALIDAPGLDVTGVFITTNTDEVQPDDLEKLDREFSAYSLNRRPAAARFPQFPYLIRADESALPASTSLHDLNLVQDPLEPNNFDEKSSLSLPSRVKRAFATTSRRQQVEDVKRRLAARGKKLTDGPELDPTKLAAVFQDGEESEVTEDMLSSVGVVHIDGNGVGAIMRDLGTAHRAVQKTGVSTISDEVTTEQNSGLQSFIMEVNRRLDDVVKEAIALSWYDVQELTPDTVVPIAPVLVGGDDVTVYTDGRYAIPFAEAYIRHYEELTKDDSLLSVLAIVAGGKKTNAPERGCFRLEDYIVQEPGPLTASAGAAIVGRNFPFHIAYDLAEGLVSRGKKLGKKPGASPCSTIDFHVLRDATVLDPEDTLDEYEGRTQRPFLVGHYAPERIGDATTASASDGVPQTRDPWKRILRAVAAFNGRDPDSPDVARSEPFPRARANRIVKLLAQEAEAGEADKTPRACPGYVLKADEKVLAPHEEIKADESREDKDKKTKRCKHPICTILAEWSDAQENASGAKGLVKRLTALPSQARLANSVEPTEDCIEQVRWLLDLIDLSENLPDGYLASRISADADRADPEEAADHPIEGGAK